MSRIRNTFKAKEISHIQWIQGMFNFADALTNINPHTFVLRNRLLWSIKFGTISTKPIKKIWSIGPHWFRQFVNCATVLVKTVLHGVAVYHEAFRYSWLMSPTTGCRPPVHHLWVPACAQKLSVQKLVRWAVFDRFRAWVVEASVPETSVEVRELRDPSEILQFINTLIFGKHPGL